MIIKKPYKFLIKYFKLIHIIMFIMFVILTFMLRNIRLFLVDYVSTGNFKYSLDLASKYIPFYSFIIAVLLFIGGIVIHLLMKKKEKPVLFYKILIAYSLVLIVFFIYFYSFFASLENSIYDPLKIVIHRDIVSFIYYINYFYVVFCFVRGFGFDIKKFSFDRDKKELFVEEGDNEEYEVNVEIDKDVIKSHFRRERRELKYYIKENALVLTILLVVFVVGLGLFIYLHFFVYNKVYQEGDMITSYNINFTVKNSYYMTRDKYGDIISSSNDFVVIRLNIDNKYKSVKLDDEMFRIYVNDKYYYPVYNFSNSFSDLGTDYGKKDIKKDTSNDYILVFKIPKEEIQNIYFEILKRKSSNSSYEFYKMKVDLIYENIQKHDIKYGEVFKINSHDYILEDYDILDNVSYQYEKCVEDKCSMFTKNIVPKFNEKVLVLSIDNLNDLSDDLINNSFGIEYANKKISGKKVSFLGKNGNNIYLSVPNGMETNDTSKIIITTRSDIYSIGLW